MFRELMHILLAINLSSPKLPPVVAATFAKTIQSAAISSDVDPFVIIAIIEHESQFNERAVSGDGKDFGLMQVRGEFYYNGQHNDWLLEGNNNIRIGANAIKLDVDYCKNNLHRDPSTQEWLATYQGGKPSGYKCRPTKLTKLFEDYSICLKDVVINGADKNCKKVYWPELKDNK